MPARSETAALASDLLSPSAADVLKDLSEAERVIDSVLRAISACIVAGDAAQAVGDTKRLAECLEDGHRRAVRLNDWSEQRRRLANGLPRACNAVPTAHAVYDALAHLEKLLSEVEHQATRWDELGHPDRAEVKRSNLPQYRRAQELLTARLARLATAAAAAALRN
ncbi:hypothetical protein [Corallococcus sp. AB038B]|uniref:hypothetical protein n=1 Tax=Corallococcus sp. AB038B TaxID=2316718 RepID=UPI000EF0F084|nr:hypothetical protein [Corallococcus sp. AB038B]RKH92791.1 hypothetical protein D7Y04_42365 [Corallococcus sp. AB038B]